MCLTFLILHHVLLFSSNSHRMQLEVSKFVVVNLGRIRFYVIYYYHRAEKKNYKEKSSYVDLVILFKLERIVIVLSCTDTFKLYCIMHARFNMFKYELYI